jgi:hypothetical protein
VNAGYVQGERIGEWAFENALRPAKAPQAITAASVSEQRDTEAAEHQDIGQSLSDGR